ncbi:hypothetical protein H5410_029815 [Solanum commersonii]|uniref:Uncharacterized protein n=1 Tax=Solanum commersonii TaxID=4109 RepID=A0A9J5YEB7_SOLCO|nr:hypothetical protein H5410_029815 [Solanum commersonii]
MLYGPSIKILPDQYKSLYAEWEDISPKLIKMAHDNIFFDEIAMMYFFIEFSVPWIMKWNVEFWSKLLLKDLEGKIHGQEILDLINDKINNYHVQEIAEPQEDSLSPFKQISRKLHMKKGIVSRSETIALYMEEVKKDLMKNLDIDIGDDISMPIAIHTNQDDETIFKRKWRNPPTRPHAKAKEKHEEDPTKYMIEKSTVKNSMKEEYDIPQHPDLLNKWTILKTSSRIIYQVGTFEKLGFKQVVKTTEETITIDSDNQTFRLLSENDLALYRNIYHFMHIGLVQVAFKPLTLRGLPESFIAVLRDDRNHNYKRSLIGTIQTSLAYGPVYFNAYPNLQISLQDENSLSSLILNVKLHGYDYMLGTEVVCICYRIYYKLLHTLNPMCKIIDFKNETILIETNFDKSKVVTRRPIKWEEIDFPQEWLNDETVKIRSSEIPDMHDRIENRSISSRMTISNSSYRSPVDYLVQVPSRESTSQIRETYRCDTIRIDNDNISRPIPRPSLDLDITESEINFPDGLTT